jgi:hypothetical protein
MYRLPKVASPGETLKNEIGKIVCLAMIIRAYVKAIVTIQ